MTRELLIDSVCRRKRMAVIDDGLLCEIHYETSSGSSLSGNIYSGRVMNVLPGMNAAFVDIGLDKNAYLQAGDIRADLQGDKDLANRLENQPITKLVRPGQEIMVQVIREPGGSKGPRVSSHISLPGRLLALLPTLKYIGISRKIDDDSERTRLREIASDLLRDKGLGMIMRTAASEVSEYEIRSEYSELVEQWRSIEKRGKSVKAPALLYGRDTLEKIVVRDWLDSADSVVTDSEIVYRNLLSELSGTCRQKDIIRLYTGKLPLFDTHSVDTAYEKALKHHVWLKSGGYLVIDHTEALTVIDVNTGKYVGRKSLEETIFQTNCEAACEIARQLRLRDIGGIIIVDFIDMADEVRRIELLDLLRNETSKDRIAVSVAGMTNLGLVEITRKKKRLSAQKMLRHTCNTCNGTGFVDDFEAIAWRIIYDLRRKNLQNPDQAYTVKLSSGVAGALIAIGAPAGMKVHVITEDRPDLCYSIEPIDRSDRNLKLLRNIHEC